MPITPEFSIGQLLVAVFAAGRMADPELYKRWIAMSFRLGGLLPDSLLSVSVQRAGEVDLVCRALERELVEQPVSAIEMDFRYNYLFVLSEWFIGSVYSVCYTLSSRKFFTDVNFRTLADDLRMVRVQIEKYELPSDRDLRA